MTSLWRKRAIITSFIPLSRYSKKIVQTRTAEIKSFLPSIFILLNSAFILVRIDKSEIV